MRHVAATLSLVALLTGSAEVRAQQAPAAPPVTPPPPPAWSGGAPPWSAPAPAPAPPSPAPPWTLQPAAASGTQVVPDPSAAPVSPDAARLRALEARLAELERQDGSRQTASAWPDRLKLSGWLQPQFVAQSFDAASSPNRAADGSLPPGIGSNDVTTRADGSTTNSVRFRLRRMRFQVEFMPTDYARFFMQLDGVQINGTHARTIEAQGIARWTKDVQTELAMGLFKPPRRELIETSGDRLWVERTWLNDNITPGDRDVGARATTFASRRRLRADLAVTNGYFLGEERWAALPDLNRGKDVWARGNYDFGPVDVGLSATAGAGQNVDPARLSFRSFPRWAASLEAGLHHKLVPKLGETRISGEVTFAKNEDRGVRYAFALPPVPADPVNGSVEDRHQRGIWIRAEQQLTPWVTVGVRWDQYSPNTSQKNNQRDTYGFLAAVHFTHGLWLATEYDYAIENVHRPGGVAPSAKIHTLSSMLVVRWY